MKHVLIDADLLIHMTCAFLQPVYYWIGDEYFGTQKEAKIFIHTKGLPNDTEFIKVQYLYPPTEVKKMAGLVLANFKRSLDNVFLGEDVKYMWFLNDKKNFRKLVCEKYKAHRTERPEYHDQVKDWLINKTGAIVVEGFESDDTVSLFADALKGHCVIVGEDKDLKNIPCTHLHARKFNFSRVTPEQGMINFLSQCLIGDTVDNIGGVRRLGPIKAEAIIKELQEANIITKEADITKVWKVYTESVVQVAVTEKYTEEQVISDLLKAATLVDVGGYWTRRLSKAGMFELKTDWKPLIQRYKMERSNGD